VAARAAAAAPTWRSHSTPRRSARATCGTCWCAACARRGTCCTAGARVPAREEEAAREAAQAAAATRRHWRQLLKGGGWSVGKGLLHLEATRRLKSGKGLHQKRRSMREWYMCLGSWEPARSFESCLNLHGRSHQADFHHLCACGMLEMHAHASTAKSLTWNVNSLSFSRAASPDLPAGWRPRGCLPDSSYAQRP